MEKKTDHLKKLGYIREELYCYIRKEDVDNNYKPTLDECEGLLKNGMKKEKMIHYLEWLADEGKIHTEGENADEGELYYANKEQKRLSEMLIEMIKRGDFE